MTSHESLYSIMPKSKITTKLSLIVQKILILLKVSDLISLTCNGKQSNMQIPHVLFTSWRFTCTLKSLRSLAVKKLIHPFSTSHSTNIIKSMLCARLYPKFWGPNYVKDRHRACHHQAYTLAPIIQAFPKHF